MTDTALNSTGFYRYGETLIDDIDEPTDNPGGLPKTDGYEAQELAAIARALPVVIQGRDSDGPGPVEWAWRGQSFVLGGNLGVYRSDGSLDTLSQHLDDDVLRIRWADYDDSERFEKHSHPEADD